MNKIKAKAACKEMLEWEENLMRFQDFTNCHFQQEFLTAIVLVLSPVLMKFPAVFDNTNGLRKNVYTYFLSIGQLQKTLL